MDYIFVEEIQDGPHSANYTQHCSQTDVDSSESHYLHRTGTKNAVDLDNNKILEV